MLELQSFLYGQINTNWNKVIVFNISLQILCNQWLHEVYNTYISPDAGHLPLWCSARCVLQPSLASDHFGEYLLDKVSFNQFWCICLVLSGQDVSVYFCIHAAAVVSRDIINEHIWASSSGHQTCPSHNITPPGLTDEVVCFGSWAVPFFFFSPHLHLSISLVLVDLCLVYP